MCKLLIIRWGENVGKAARYLGVLLCVGIIISTLTQVKVLADSDDSVITIDGYFDDWSQIPYSYQINYDDSSWPLPNDSQNKNTIALYRDDKNVYLYVKMKELYTTGFNGNDYEFFIDGSEVAFAITAPGGSDHDINSFSEGIHPIWVRYQNGWDHVSGSVGYLNCNADNVGDTAEFKIPFKAFSKQNSNIDPNNIQTIEFFTPNLMYRHISCSGTSTAPYLGIGISAFAAFGGFLLFKNRKKKNS